MDGMDHIDRRLLNDFQRDLPLTPRPYAVMAAMLGISEDQVIGRLHALQNAGAVSRVGAVVQPNAVGASTLAAMAVPEHRLDEVAGIVSGFPEVNHNYEREHAFNLWFVVTAANRKTVLGVLSEIETASGIAVMDLPLVQPFHIDLGFALQWT